MKETIIPKLRPVMSSAVALSSAAAYKDKLGLEMDPQIIRPVAALNRFGVETIMSCQGHLDRALPFPWIMIPSSHVENTQMLIATLPYWTIVPNKLQPIFGGKDTFPLNSLVPSANKTRLIKWQQEINHRANQMLLV
jgi:hypothetical protein